MFYKLSICIPTFNRGHFLDKTLENIITFIRPDVEIVIMDGASTDHTENIVAKWKMKCSSINYIQGKLNKGVDSDLATCIEHAKGEYCWLMSSDDLFLETSIERVMHEINICNYSILLGCRIDCSKNMEPLRQQKWIKQSKSLATFNFTKQEDFISYFNKIDSIGALFSYISSIIIHRQSWLNIKNGEKFFGTNYAHVFRIFEMLKANGNLLYINEPIVLCRMDNDSFSSEGIVKRFKIDYLGYSEIANALFASNHKILNSMLKVLTREHRFARLLKIKFHCIDESEWDDVKNHIKIFGYPNHTLYLVELLSIFRPIIFILLRLNKFFKGKKLTRFKKID